ncbi:MAG: T9SS type A sorting domain-containing protein [Ignavibacteria bacterium]|jgi:hypothetical protein
MNKEEKLLLQKKLLKYSLVAGGMLSGVNANVVTTNVDTTLTNNQYLDIDFEGTDGIDITIRNFYFPGTTNAMIVNGSASTSFLGKLNGLKFYPYVLTQNDNISVTPATGTWGKGTDNIGTLTYDRDGSTRGLWRNQNNKYLGVKFDISGETHYGWVLLSVDSDADEITVHSYAYETEADTPISSPLPVELTLFSAILKDNSVKLNWETATEVNNYGFQVERKKIKGKSDLWEKIGFVNGHGNSNSPKSYSFIDNLTLNPNHNPATAGRLTLHYRLKQIDFNGSYEYSDIVEISFTESLTPNFALNQNYPNPFNPTTIISYVVPNGVEESKVKLEIFDSIGRLVATLVDENQPAGSYSYNFNAEGLPSGTYAYRLTTDNFSETKKMLLIK